MLRSGLESTSLNLRLDNDIGHCDAGYVRVPDLGRPDDDVPKAGMSVKVSSQSKHALDSHLANSPTEGRPVKALLHIFRP